MNWPYAYTPYIWPMLATAAVLIMLGAFAWRRRDVPASVPFVALASLWAAWALAGVLEIAAVDPATKYFWFLIEAVLKVPTLTCGLVVVLAYAGLDKWLNRTTITLLFLPSLILSVLIFTNPAHHLAWPSVSYA